MSLYLAHHGILGMKWGVRRYQNEDGSLTTAGKKRYYNSDGSLTSKGRKRFYTNKHVISRHGAAYNEANMRDYKQYEKKIHERARENDPQFKQYEKRYKQLTDESKRLFEKEHDRFGKQHQYKGYDYYKFKQKIRRDYEKSNAGKEKTNTELYLRNKIYEQIRKDNDSNKKLIMLPSNQVKYPDLFKEYRTIEYGKAVTMNILDNISDG